MTVWANCTDCSSRHRLGAREGGWTTTLCPDCGSPCYPSECDSDGYEDDLPPLSHVAGVGDAVIDEIEKRYTRYELEAATTDELTRVPNVGEKTAANIVEAL